MWGVCEEDGSTVGSCYDGCDDISNTSAPVSWLRLLNRHIAPGGSPSCYQLQSLLINGIFTCVKFKQKNILYITLQLIKDLFSIWITVKGTYGVNLLSMFD